MLDDPRDAVRNEGLVLLTNLSRSSSELQKLFVFEDAFTKVFGMIQADGGLLQGGVVVQDCLSLLANLVRFNASNQTNIREMGHIARVASLLPGGNKSKKPRFSQDEEDDWTSPQSDKNVWGLLAILRMFLVKGSAGTPQNQTAFQKHGLLRQLLNIAFDPATVMPIKIEALNTCADMIRGNPRLQEGFAQEQVRPMIEPVPNGASTPNGVRSVYVIEALLNLVLTPAPNDLFNLRNAACECVRAYFYNHLQIREHFLNRAIGGHEEGDETANALSILMAGPQGSESTDPYRLWFASTLIYHLIVGDIRSKNTLMQVKEGDAESGEEVVTCIQTLTANLVASLQLEEDERISIAYLMLLTEWLFEDAAGVDDFLGEASSLQSLVQATLTPGEDRTIIRGLCAALLGVIYEFSTRDSPVPRRELQPVLTTKLGREKYLDAISELRQHPLVRDFEVLPRTNDGGGSLPKVYFDEMFIDFLKDNFSRLTRAIDRNPNIEQHQSHEGVDRDVVDALRNERDEKEQTIQELRTQLMTLEQNLGQEQAQHRKTQQAAEEQRTTLKKINDKLHDDLDKEVAVKAREHKQAMLESENKYNLRVVDLNNKLQQASKEASINIARARQESEEKLHAANKARDDIERRLDVSEKVRQDEAIKYRSVDQAQQQLRTENAKLKDSEQKLQKQIEGTEAQIKKLKQDHEAQLSKSKQDYEAQLKQLRSDKDSLQSSVDRLKSENQGLRTQIQDQTWKVKDAEEKVRKAESSARGSKEGKERELKSLQEKLRAAEKSTEEKQTELDDLFVLLGDLEEKRSRDKVCVTLTALCNWSFLLTRRRNVSRSWARRSLMAKKTKTKTRRKRKRKKKTIKRVEQLYMSQHIQSQR